MAYFLIIKIDVGKTVVCIGVNDLLLPDNGSQDNSPGQSGAKSAEAKAWCANY